MVHDSHFRWNYGSSPPKRIANIFHLLCSTFCKVQRDIILHLRFQHIHHFRTFQNTPTWNSLKNAPGPVAWYHISGRIWNLTCTDWNILGNCHWPRRWKPTGFPKWHADVEFVHENTCKNHCYLSIGMVFIGYLGPTRLKLKLQTGVCTVAAPTPCTPCSNRLSTGSFFWWV